VKFYSIVCFLYFLLTGYWPALTTPEGDERSPDVTPPITAPVNNEVLRKEQDDAHTSLLFGFDTIGYRLTRSGVDVDRRASAV